MLANPSVRAATVRSAPDASIHFDIIVSVRLGLGNISGIQRSENRRWVGGIQRSESRRLGRNTAIKSSAATCNGRFPARRSLASMAACCAATAAALAELLAAATKNECTPSSSASKGWEAMTSDPQTATSLSPLFCFCFFSRDRFILKKLGCGRRKNDLTSGGVGGVAGVRGPKKCSGKIDLTDLTSPLNKSIN